VYLTNSAEASNVFWLVEGVIDIKANCNLAGTYISNTASITAGAGFLLRGRILTKAGAITLDTITSYSLGSSTYTDNTDIENLFIYTKSGAISTTSYGLSGQLDLKITTDAGIITGFGPYNGSFPLSEGVIGVKLYVYLGEIKQVDSVFNIDGSLDGSNKALTAGYTILVDDVSKRTVSVRAESINDYGGIVFNSRSLLVSPLYVA
jgi:hypothetical protein